MGSLEGGGLVVMREEHNFFLSTGLDSMQKLVFISLKRYGLIILHLFALEYVVAV